MFCRKCGQEFDSTLTSCPNCGTEVLKKEEPPVKTEAEPSASTIEEAPAAEASKKKMNLKVLIPVAVVLLVLAFVFLGGSNNGTFEKYSWDMTYDEVISTGEKQDLINLSKKKNAVVFFVKDFWGEAGSDAMVTFDFKDSDGSLSKVSVMTAGPNETDAVTYFEQYLVKMKKLHGTPVELDEERKHGKPQFGKAKWDTPTGKAELGMLGGLVMVNYYQEGFEE